MIKYSGAGVGIIYSLQVPFTIPGVKTPFGRPRRVEEQGF
jgi:hypothetical protein